MRILRITSKDNKTLKAMRQPEHSGNILVEGPKLIAEARAGNVHLNEIVVASSRIERYHELLRHCAETGTRLLQAPDRIMAGIGDAVTGQGIIALSRNPEVAMDRLPRSRGGLVLVLDAIQDPGNVGAMLRSAFAFGASAVVILDGSANPFGGKAIRASAGACFHVPVAMASVDEFLKYCLDAGLPLVALDGSAKTDISENALPADCAIIVGNEGAGIRAELRQACEAAFRIPIGDELDSLNAAVAASIALYELARKHTAP